MNEFIDYRIIEHGSEILEIPDGHAAIHARGRLPDGREFNLVYFVQQSEVDDPGFDARTMAREIVKMWPDDAIEA